MASVRIIGILCSGHLETSQWSVAGRCLSLSVVEFGLVRTTLNSAGIARQQSVGVDALELYRPKPFFRLRNRSPSQPLEAPGMTSGGWSVWMAARWTWPMRKLTRKPLGGPARAAARAHIRKSALSHWSRTGPTCCLRARWRTMGPVKSHWPKPYWLVFARACFAWRIDSSSVSRCGIRRGPPARICSGESKRTAGWLLSEPDLCFGTRLATQGQRGQGARHRLYGAFRCARADA